MDSLVTHHAIERYRQRVADVSDEQIIATLSTPAIERAIAFGCRAVKLGTGHMAVIAGGRVVTVFPKRSTYV